jgi:hypothetical protein
MVEFLLVVVLLPIALPILYNTLMVILGAIGIVGVTVAAKQKKKAREKAKEDERIAWTYVDEFGVSPEDMGLNPYNRPSKENKDA